MNEYDNFNDDYADYLRDGDTSYGDPRKCPRHPNVAISSPDGMFDCDCSLCEAEADRGDDVEAILDPEEATRKAAEAERLNALNETDPIVAYRMGTPLRASFFDDDIPF